MDKTTQCQPTKKNCLESLIANSEARCLSQNPTSKNQNYTIGLCKSDMMCEAGIMINMRNEENGDVRRSSLQRCYGLNKSMYSDRSMEIVTDRRTGRVI